jgi:hypothetical protein
MMILLTEVQDFGIDIAKMTLSVYCGRLFENKVSAIHFAKVPRM